VQDNALYFPYISVPNESWTIKTLMYWDKLASIVPMDHMHEPERLTPFMRELVRSDLVEQLFPGQFIWQLEHFESSFIKMIEARLSKQKGWGKGSRLGKSRVNRLGSWVESARNPNNLRRVHAEKMGSIPRYLISSGLARETEGYDWYLVEKNVANLFMCYLATCLGAMDQVGAVPVTNKIQNTIPFGSQSPYSRANNRHRQKARDLVLEKLLPVPNEKVRLDDLLRFKNDHGRLLPPLRLMVENHCAEVSRIEDPHDRVDLSLQFLNECKDSIQEIEDAMKPTWKKITFGSLLPIGASGLAWSAVAPGSTLGNLAAGTSFLASAYTALSQIQEPRRRVENKPLAYVAHAHMHLGRRS